jgi:hypothetical protein
MRVPKDGSGPPEVLASGQAPRAIGVTPTRVFWTNVWPPAGEDAGPNPHSLMSRTLVCPAQPCVEVGDEAANSVRMRSSGETVYYVGNYSGLGDGADHGWARTYSPTDGRQTAYNGGLALFDLALVGSQLFASGERDDAGYVVQGQGEAYGVGPIIGGIAADERRVFVGFAVDTSQARTPSILSFERATDGGKVADFASPGTIASGERVISALAVDATFLYWLVKDEGLIRRQTKDGSLAIETVMTNQDRPADLALDATHLYWITASGVFAKRK